jgi:hypothetical protein
MVRQPSVPDLREDIIPSSRESTLKFQEIKEEEEDSKIGRCHKYGCWQ